MHDLAARGGIEPASRGDLLANALVLIAPADRPEVAEVIEVLRSLLPGGRRGKTGADPFRGLLPFGEEHAAQFHGLAISTRRRPSVSASFQG